MRSRTSFLSADEPSRRRTARRADDRRLNARRLLLEPLEDRALLTFAAPAIYPVVPNTHSLATADFTGDGILDAATETSNFIASQVAVLVGNGDGSFQPAQLSPSPGGSLVAGDLDGDGKADLVVVNSTSLNVLISNGNGTFRPAQPVTLPPQTPNDPDYTGGPLAQEPIAAVVGDLNADGHLDLVATGITNHTIVTGPGSYGGYYEYNVRSTYVNVLLGTGAGTFDGAATNFFGNNINNSSRYSFGPDVGDFNGDGNLDLLTSSAFFSGPLASSNLSAQLGKGDGTFQAARITSNYTGAHFVQHAVADFNQDGRTDVLMGGAEYATATVALGNADGTFTPLNPFDIGQIPSHDVVDREVGDVNGDGKIDLVFVKKLYENRWADILLGKGDGTFAKPIRYDLGTLAYANATLADFDGDGLADLAAVDRNVGVIVHMNSGSSSPPLPELRITDASVAEGNSGTTTMTFMVTLTHAAAEPVTLQYATANGTATSGSDYQAAAGTLVIPSGQTTGTITVPVIRDRLPEPNEVFFVNVSGATGAIIADAQAAGTIVDDEPRISISDVTKEEGRRNKKTQFTFTVTLSAAYDQPVTMSFQTANGTATASDNDYVTKSGTLTFAPGETTKTITIEVKGDSKTEADETFYLDLFGLSSNALFTKNRGIGTILNDD